MERRGFFARAAAAAAGVLLRPMEARALDASAADAQLRLLDPELADALDIPPLGDDGLREYCELALVDADGAEVDYLGYARKTAAFAITQRQTDVEEWALDLREDVCWERVPDGTQIHVIRVLLWPTPERALNTYPLLPMGTPYIVGNGGDLILTPNTRTGSW